MSLLEKDYEIDAPETAPAIGRAGQLYLEQFQMPEVPDQDASDPNATAWAFAMYEGTRTRQSKAHAANLALLMVSHHHAPPAPSIWNRRPLGLTPWPYDRIYGQDDFSGRAMNTPRFFAGTLTCDHTFANSTKLGSSLTVHTLTNHQDQTFPIAGSYTVCTQDVVYTAWTHFDPLKSIEPADPLDGFDLYSERDWDGYGAEPISQDTIDAARTFIGMLPNTFGDPDIAPGGDGTIGLQWVFKDGPLRKLFIDIGPGRTWGAYWRKFNGESETTTPTRMSMFTPQTLSELFQKLAE